MQLPKLSPEYVRREARPDYDPEMWKPDWKCFCCHDYGTVVSHLVTKVIPDFDHHNCLQVLCQNPGCEPGKGLSRSENMASQLDRRFTPEVCAHLEQLEQENWRETLKVWREKKQQAKENQQTEENPVADAMSGLTNKFAMPGTKPRTENDQREIDQKAAEAQAKLDSQKQQAMSRYSRLQELQEELEPDSQEHLGF